MQESRPFAGVGAVVGASPCFQQAANVQVQTALFTI